MAAISMRNSRLFKFGIIGLFSITLWTSCGDPNAKKPEKNGIDAEILNLIDSTLIFESVVSPINQIKGSTPSFSKSITVDSNGIFVEPLDLQEGYYHLIYDQNKVLYFVQHGKRLSLDFDASQPTKKPEYSGKLKYESRYLYDRNMLMANFISNKESYFELSENEFVEVVNHVRSKLDTLLVMYITNHPTGSRLFMQQEMLSNLYFEASFLEQYPMQHSQLTENDGFELSANYYTALNNLNLNDTNAIENPQYYDFVYNHVWNRVGLPTNSANVVSHIHYVDSIFTDSDVQDYLHFKAAREVAQWNNTEDRKNMLDTLLYAVTNQKIKAFLATRITSDTTPVLMDSVLIEQDK